MANTTLRTRLQLRHDTKANWEANKSVVLLAGECGVETDTKKFKFGDGVTTWENLPYAGAQVKVEGEGDVIVGAELNSSGELVLTKGKLLDTTVLMSDDFVFTANVGTVTIPASGSTTVSARDKTLREFLSSIFAKAKNPNITQPSMSVTLHEAKAYEVGTLVTPSYSISFNGGSYQYGPATGVTATAYSAIGNADETTRLTTQTGRFDAIVVDEMTNYRVGASVTYTDGVAPKNNLGTEVPSLKITSKTISASSFSITGYRNSFWGSVTSKTGSPTSATIRGLSGKKNGNILAGNTGDAVEAVGAMRVIIAVPSPRTITSIKDVNGLNAEAFSAFKHEVINVEGANKFTPMAYNVYYKDNASACDKANKWHFTVA